MKKTYSHSILHGLPVNHSYQRHDNVSAEYWFNLNIDFIRRLERTMKVG